MDNHHQNVYENNLDIESFTHMLDDPTECYKFYWLEAIVDLVKEGKSLLYFDEIIDQMIADAWYSVNEYHLHLGPRDREGKIVNSLERAVCKLQSQCDMKNNASREEILLALKRSGQLLHDEKYQISKMVPYRALSAFLQDIGGNDRIWDQRKRLIAYIEHINEEILLPYIIIDGKGLNKKVMMNEYWEKMILDNNVAILGWIRLKKVRYLQDRNPGVPGIIYKLELESEKLRKLKKVRELWLAVMELVNIKDIYTNRFITKTDFEIDHFVPWSYISNDELWNLSPIESSLNSKKSDKLPKWDRDFKKFADVQYLLYQMIYTYEGLEKLFEACRRDNLVSIWAQEELYITGNSKEKFVKVLKNNLKPVYDSAKTQGYRIWDIIKN